MPDLTPEVLDILTRNATEAKDKYPGASVCALSADLLLSLVAAARERNALLATRDELEAAVLRLSERVGEVETERNRALAILDQLRGSPAKP